MSGRSHSTSAHCLPKCGYALSKAYRDLPMDLADATLVLTAEKTGYRQILTLDSDFLFYRIGNRDSFDIIQVR